MRTCFFAVGLLALAVTIGCKKEADVSKPPALMSKRVPKLPVGEMVAIPRTEWLYPEPVASESARISRVKRGDEAESPVYLSAANGGALDHQCMTVADSGDDWVKVSTECASDFSCAPFFLSHLPVHLYVQRQSLLPVLVRELSQEFEDGTFIKARPGSVARKGESAGTYWLEAHGVRVQVRLPEDAVGLTYTGGGRNAAVSKLMGDERAYFGRGGSVGGLEAELVPGDVMRRQGPGRGVDVYALEVDGDNRHVYAFNGCVDARLSVPSSSVRVGARFKSPPESVHLNPPARWMKVSDGATAYWPSGAVAASATKWPSFYARDARAVGDRVCVDVAAPSAYRGALELCFDGTSVTMPAQ